MSHTTSDLGSKLEELSQVENSIMKSLEGAQKCFTELGKDKTTNKQATEGAIEFYENLKKAEEALSKHIDYLAKIGFTTIHEGSSYAALREEQAAFDRLNQLESEISGRLATMNKSDGSALQPS